MLSRGLGLNTVWYPKVLLPVWNGKNLKVVTLNEITSPADTSQSPLDFEEIQKLQKIPVCHQQIKALSVSVLSNPNSRFEQPKYLFREPHIDHLHVMF